MEKGNNKNKWIGTPGIMTLMAIIFLLFAGCSLDTEDPPPAGTLTFVSSHPLGIEDPSGLTLDASGTFLWTVSDMQNGLVYKITFEGDIIGSLKYRGDDMEGITMNPNDHTLWIVEERKRQLVQLDTLGNILQVVDIPVLIVNENDGPEGVAIDPVTEHLFILNEKSPREFIEMDDQFEVVRRIIVQFTSEFRLDDLSGLFYVSDNREFWIVSDESMRIVVTDFELNPIRSYNLGRQKFEGIAVDPRIGRVYLVNDEENRLYVYSYL